MGVVWTFLLSSILFSPLSPSLWETARYRLKHCLKGPLSLKQPTNQIFVKSGWCDGAGKTSSAGASYNLDYSRARAYCTCSRCGWGLFGHLLSSILSFLFLPGMARYRLKYCLKGPVNPKQPTNQPNLC